MKRLWVNEPTIYTLHFNKCVCVQVILIRVTKLEKRQFYRDLFLAGKTTVTFNTVPDYFRFELLNTNLTYTVYFAKDCKFPTPNSGKIIE